jgi:hypothetical protein
MNLKRRVVCNVLQGLGYCDTIRRKCIARLGDFTAPRADPISCAYQIIDCAEFSFKMMGTLPFGA